MVALSVYKFLGFTFQVGHKPVGCQHLMRTLKLQFSFRLYLGCRMVTSNFVVSQPATMHYCLFLELLTWHYPLGSATYRGRLFCITNTSVCPFKCFFFFQKNSLWTQLLLPEDHTHSSYVLIEARAYLCQFPRQFVFEVLCPVISSCDQQMHFLQADGAGVALS